MSIEAYEEILKTIQDDPAISDAERELTEGQELLNARDAFSALRRKHFG